MSHSRSLTRMHLEYFDFSRARLELLHQFVIENDNLSDLGLHACGLSVEDAALALGVPFLPEALGLENWLDHWLF